MRSEWLRQPRPKSKYWQRRWASMPKKKRDELLSRANIGPSIVRELWQDDQSWWSGSEERDRERQERERVEWLKKQPK